MSAHTHKSQEDKSHSVANAFSQKQSGGDSPFQFTDNRPEAIAQRKLRDLANNRQPLQRKPNNTGMPDNLKAGVENLSGYSMDDVKVHYNSPKPATLQAHAYAQGTDIHLGPGQERHLPHEAWHVVQQKQGRVRPTMQMKGNVNINDDAGLEKEADVMGGSVLQDLTFWNIQSKPENRSPIDETVQLLKIGNLASGTDSNTLIHPVNDTDQVDNIDTGHMVIADILLSDLSSKSWEEFINQIMQNITIQYPRNAVTLEGRKKWFQGVVLKDRGSAAGYLKRYMKMMSGHQGARNMYDMLVDEDKYQVAMRLQNLADFKLGDSGRLAIGQYDKVYIINALGFDPLNDATQVRNIARAIKSGGLLKIIAEATGESVSSFWNRVLAWSEGNHSKDDLKNPEFLNIVIGEAGSQIIKSLMIGEYFDIVGYSVNTKDQVLNEDENTKRLVTRHTFASTLQVEMEDNIPTISLELERRDEKVE